MTAGDSDHENRKAAGLLSRLGALFGKSDDVITNGLANARENAASGVAPGRREMIERVIAFDEKKVVDVMAPRADIFAVDYETSLNQLILVFSEAGHSRMPVYRGDLDDPVGMVHIKDVVGLIAGGVKASDDDAPILKSLKREILYVPPSMRITDLLLRMQASRIHMALVIDEYGGTDGLVTIEDLVEEIVGEINDEHDEDDMPTIIPRDGGGWNVDARVELEDFYEETGIDLRLEDAEIDTLGGYVFSLAGGVPRRGEVLTGPLGYDFEVMEADARKIRKLHVRPAATNQNEAAE